MGKSIDVSRIMEPTFLFYRGLVLFSLWARFIRMEPTF